MTTKSLEEKIGSAVERLVREHLAECEAAAAAAVHEAFGRAARPGSKRRGGTPAPGRRRSPSRRRGREEIAQLEERLYQAICAHPGETMVVIAEAVGATPRELNRPATLLRDAGRVRSVGQRQYTRYFPIGA
jgi:hypothetical protein